MCRLRNTSREKRRWRRQNWRKPSRFSTKKGYWGKNAEQGGAHEVREVATIVFVPQKGEAFTIKISFRRRTCAGSETHLEKTGDGGVRSGASRAGFRPKEGIRGGKGRARQRCDKVASDGDAIAFAPRKSASRLRRVFRFAATEQQRDAPCARQRDQRVDDPADDRGLPAEDPRHEVELEQPDGAPVDRPDNDEKQCDSVYQHTVSDSFRTNWRMFLRRLVCAADEKLCVRPS